MSKVLEYTRKGIWILGVKKILNNLYNIYYNRVLELLHV